MSSPASISACSNIRRLAYEPLVQWRWLPSHGIGTYSIRSATTGDELLSIALADILGTGIVGGDLGKSRDGD